jgi:demethylmenaquinone methyltransferase/2-methoxy-6-polyprenyl-1,4-benzoquinol methylase
MSDNQKNTTHFGYQEVPVDEKVNRVADVFHSVAAKYDVMNDLMSGGIHRIWKRITIESSGARPGHKILDIAGGTGDLTRRFANIVGKSGKVVLADINDSMLKVGRDKLIDKGVAGNVEYVQANAECLPFEDNTFDIITIESSGARPGHKILDIAGGTGDLTRRFAQIVGQSGKVVLADINDSMLKVGRDKLIDKGVAGNVEYVQANAECLPFEDNTFDIITIAFGLRNVTDKDAALRSMNRVLKPGGKLMVLEFSKTENPLLTKAYDFYSFNLLPKMGQLIANDAESYRYLAESIRMHPDQETLKGMMDSAGFVQTRYRNLTQGIVALHTGIKP